MTTSASSTWPSAHSALAPPWRCSRSRTTLWSVTRSTPARWQARSRMPCRSLRWMTMYGKPYLRSRSRRSSRVSSLTRRRRPASPCSSGSTPSRLASSSRPYSCRMRVQFGAICSPGADLAELRARSSTRTRSPCAGRAQRGAEPADAAADDDDVGSGCGVAHEDLLGSGVVLVRATRAGRGRRCRRAPSTPAVAPSARPVRYAARPAERPGDGGLRAALDEHVGDERLEEVGRQVVEGDARVRGRRRAP